jgi:hypothetical protein
LEVPVPLDLRDLSRLALLLDVDGTLDIAPTPQEVVVPRDRPKRCRASAIA